jgi:uncharacterized protein YdeI (YjbR/CyaY-like superfamily)
MNPKVDALLRRTPEWREETKILRGILLGLGLDEDVKWNKPCYALNGSNVAIIQGFKEYSALMFFKGPLLKDPKHILTAPGEHSQAARQIRFTTAREVTAMKATVKAYVREAIAVEKAGLKVNFKRSPEPVPRELKDRLDESPALKAAFAALTPGRQRHYILFISGAVQSATRAARVGKCMPRILSGKGLND